MKKLRVALLGFGVVGSGVYEMLRNPPYDSLVSIECIFVKHLDKDRQDVPIRLFTDQVEDVFEPHKIDVIIEAMGGLNPAQTMIRRAIKERIHVITANKEVVDHDFYSFVEHAQKSGVAFLFEASVVAGVPIISSLVELAYSDRITRIEGILNGATNYVLTHVFSGLSYEESVDKARKQGFLEADPKDDFEGFDALRKIMIMARIAFKSEIDQYCVFRYGLKRIGKTTIDFLKARGWRLKQVAQAECRGASLHVSVEPMIVESASLLGSVEHEDNVIVLYAEQRGRLVMIGKGAGKKTTAAAMVNDLMLILNKRFYSVEADDKTVSSKKKNSTEIFSYLLEVSDTKPFESIARTEYERFIITKPITREVIDSYGKDVFFYARIHEEVQL